MKIEIRNIKKTKLNQSSLVKVIEKYSNLHKKVRLIFTSRLNYCGRYTYISKQKTHQIELSVVAYQFADQVARIYEIIGSLLHELRHAEQQEKLGGAKMMSKQFHGNSRIKASGASDFFSICESEARIAEETNLMSAVDYYWKNCDNVVM